MIWWTVIQLFIFRISAAFNYINIQIYSDKGPTVSPISVFHLLIQVAVLLYDSDPGQHVLSVLGLEQVLAVWRGQPQHVLPLRVAVRDVDQAGLDADWQGLVHRLAVGVSMSLLLVLVQAEVVTSQHGVHLLPRAHTSADTLRKQVTRKQNGGN